MITQIESVFCEYGKVKHVSIVDPHNYLYSDNQYESTRTSFRLILM